MADIQYLNYGDLQIEKLAFLNKASNEVQNYVQKLPWSNKRKLKFMSAYSDIMSHGINGASNSTGQWVINVGGNPIDLNSKDKKDREMYQEAAYFIQQQMAGLPTKSDQEKKDESELPKYDSFINNFSNYLSKTYYGGNPIRTQEDWNILDERNPNTGLRGTDKRVKRLSDYLKAYSSSLEEGKYNFEGSPFRDLTDLKTRINNAITKLDDGTWNLDDTDALNAIGLRSSDWFNNGSGDIYTDDNGNQYTYADYYGKILPARLKQDAEEKAAKQKAAQQTAYNNTLFFNKVTNSKMLGLNAQALKEKYKDSNSLLTALQGYSLKDIRTLTPDELSEVQGAYRYLAKLPIDNKLLKQLLSSSSGRYVGASPNRFRKINGIDNLIWDSVAKLVIQINTRQQQQAILNLSADLFANVLNKGQARENYLKSKKDGLTSAEWEELASIGFDIASIVDPEMISAGALALTGSGLRHHAALNLPGGMSTSDKWWQAADYGLSILGSIPVLGDAALTARAVNNLKKAIVPLGIVMAGANVPQAAKAAYNKVVNGLDLTIQDWRAIGAVLTAAVGVGRGRLMSKRAEALRRTGGNTSKTTKEGVIKTSEGEIKVDEATTKLLKELFKKADGATRTQKLRQNTKVQEAARLLGIDLSKAEVLGYGKFSKSPISYTPSTSITSGNRVATLRAISEFNKNHGWLARKGLAEQDWIFRHTGGYTSNPHRRLWQSVKDYFGKSKWDNFGLLNNNTKVSETSSNKSTETPRDLEKATKKWTMDESMKEWKNILKGELKPLAIGENFKAGDFHFNVMGHSGSEKGMVEINFGSKRKSIKFENLKDLRKKVLKFMKENAPKTTVDGKSKYDAKKMGEILRLLKAKGIFKQGGTIDKQKIQKYKEFIKK